MQSSLGRARKITHKKGKMAGVREEWKETRREGKVTVEVTAVGVERKPSLHYHTRGWRDVDLTARQVAVT